MKDQGSATKLVLRHLPPGLSEAALRAQIESRFSGRFNWFCFRPAQTSLSHGHNQKHQVFSRAYIQMKTPQDVFEFADVFNNHVFVDEKGTQCKSIVEYAPYQAVPDTSKKDPREGTIDKDPKYLEFLEVIAKPTENLPSAEIQLERKEAERAVAPKDDVVVTPLMEYVRQKRAAKSGPLRSSSSRKSGGRTRGVSGTSIGLVNKRGIEKSKLNNATYVVRDGARTSSNKEKATYILVQQREQQQSRDNQISIEKNRKDVSDGKDQHISSESSFSFPCCSEILEDEGGTSMKTIQESTDEMTSGADATGEAGKRRLLLSKDREKEVSNGAAGGSSLSPNSMDVGVQFNRRQTSNFKGSSAQQMCGVMSPGKGASSMSFKQSQRWESSGRAGRAVMLTKDLQLPVTSSNLEQHNQMMFSNFEKDKRPPRHPGSRSSLKDHLASSSFFVDVDATSKDSHGPIATAERQDRRTRNKDRPDRPVWTPRRRPDGFSLSDASQASAESVTKFQGAHEGASKTEKISTSRQKTGFVEKGEDIIPQVDLLKTEIVMASVGDVEGQGNTRPVFMSGENGNHRQILRRPSTREVDGASVLGESKPVKRSASVGYGGQEKQVWVAVQKSGSCS